MSKAKLGNVLSNAGLCITTIFDNDGYQEIRLENQDISEDDIVEIDVEASKKQYCLNQGCSGKNTCYSTCDNFKYF
ncbi:MAG: hypothetical protein WC343_11255, partial [Bacilli bacterium]